MERTEVEIEVANRIKVSVWAYAYELESDSIVSDEVFDETCLSINPKLSTGNTKRIKTLDKFFQEEFNAYTGQWIHKHPELDKIRELYNKYYKDD